VRATTAAEAEADFLSRYGGAAGPSPSVRGPAAAGSRAAAIAAMGREAARAQEAARAEQLKRQADATSLVTILKQKCEEKRRPYMQHLLEPKMVRCD
jgi:hypothetical protein